MVKARAPNAPIGAIRMIMPIRMKRMFDSLSIACSTGLPRSP